MAAESYKPCREEGEQPHSIQVRIAVLLGAVFLMSAVLLGVLTVTAGKPSTVLVSHSPLQITEYMTGNAGAFPDENGQFFDWVELCNTGATAMALKGWALTDGNNTWLLPDRSLEPAAYLVIFCSGQADAVNHAGFRLKAAGGETVSLKNPAGEVVESVKTMPLTADSSAVRTADGFEETARFTPGYPNTDEGAAAFEASRSVKQTALLFNEVMANNTLTFPDTDGRYADYVELRNTTDQAISLYRYGLTNDAAKPLKWQFPDVSIPAGGTIVVFASGTGASSGSGELHASFRIDRAHDVLYLSSPAGVLIDRVTVDGMDADVALLRGEDGSWSRSDTPSPGFPNTDAGVEAFWKLRDSRMPKTLRIHEVMSRSTPKDSGSTSPSVRAGMIAGKAYDWVELYNPTDKAISLKGWHLTNNVDEPALFALPDVTVPAGGYRLVFCTGERVTTSSAYIQATFTLNGSGGGVALFAADGTLADGMAYHNLPLGASAGRMENRDGYFYFASPTPGQANGTAGVRYLSATPTTPTKAGVYNGVSDFQVELAGEGRIYYTLDGSDPTASSTRYQGPISLNKTAVVRAVSIRPGALASDALTVSYILNENHSLEVVSLVSNPDNLYSPSRGIYVKGNNASSTFPYTGANFWMGWERDAHLEFFAQDAEGFSVPCGIKVFGAFSRGYEKKSLSVFFRDGYGESELTYPLFASRDFLRYESLVLRSTGQDRMRALMRDALITSVADDASILETQAYRPVVLYVNGEYFGVYYLREKISQHFIATHQNVPAASVDLLQGNSAVNYGSNTDYKELMTYVAGHDLRQTAYYQYVLDRVDVTSLCDYKIAEIYCANGDTGNIRFYRSSATDGKWRWILFDTDMGLRGEPNCFWNNLNPAGHGHANAFSNTLFTGLLKNDQFRALFIERLEYNMKHVWTTEKMLGRLEELHQKLQPEIARNHAKYAITTNWEGEIANLRQQLQRRQTTMKKELASASVQAIFHLSDAQIAQCFE